MKKSHLNYIFFYIVAAVKLQSLYRGHKTRKKKIIKQTETISDNAFSQESKDTVAEKQQMPTAPVAGEVRVRRPSSAGAGKLKAFSQQNQV